LKPLRAAKRITSITPDHLGDSSLIRTNDQGKNFRLVTAPINNRPRKLERIIPHRKDVMLEDVVAGIASPALERINGVPDAHL
jgi:oligopeptidase B